MHFIKSHLLPLLIICLLPVSVIAAGEQSSTAEVDIWAQVLKPKYFTDRDITEGQSIIEIKVPVRAEDAGIVPVSIHAKIPQTPELYIKELFVFVDKNPIPLAANFHLTPAIGKADLALRLRINTRSFVRVVAEMNNGELYMDSAATRASGGCTLPPPYLALKSARERIGQMKFKSRGKQQSSDEDLQLGQLIISHPNVTGLQLDQRTRSYIPAEYMTYIKVSYMNEEIFSADTGISISEDPSFRFFFKPEKGGLIRADMTDNKGRDFTKYFEVN